MLTKMKKPRKNCKNYNFQCSINFHCSISIDADSLDKAEEKAREILQSVLLDNIDSSIDIDSNSPSDLIIAID